MDLSPNQCAVLGSLVTANDSSECEAQFASLVGRQCRFVFRIAYSVVRNAHDAEDIVQETFLKLYRTGAWKSMQDEKAFLARTTWRMAVEKQASHKNAVQPHEALRFPAPDPEARAIDANTDRLVHALIDALPDALRLPLVLSALEELTSAEIAQIMNISEGTVRSRIFKARQVLREKLERILGERNVRR